MQPLSEKLQGQPGRGRSSPASPLLLPSSLSLAPPLVYPLLEVGWQGSLGIVVLGAHLYGSEHDGEGQGSGTAGNWQHLRRL